MPITERHTDISPDVRYSGFCAACGRVHSLGIGDAYPLALALMQELERRESILVPVRPADDSGTGCAPHSLPTVHDAASPEAAAARPTSAPDNAHFSTDYLWGPARGQMFGVLSYRDGAGRHGALRAFSCQYNGMWRVEGWVPPVFDVEEFHRRSDPVEREIKRLSRRIEEQPKDSVERAALMRERKAMSQDLMREIHDLYRLHNFRGQTRRMADVFAEFATVTEARQAVRSNAAFAQNGSGTLPVAPDALKAGFGAAPEPEIPPRAPGKGLPTGMGDCCAPKLLEYAARHGLTPTGLAEFYWGRENRSATRRHGEFYPSCTDKCGPILGFMLCGLDGC